MDVIHDVEVSDDHFGMTDEQAAQMRSDGLLVLDAVVFQYRPAPGKAGTVIEKIIGAD